MIAGVCGGLAEYLHTDPTLMSAEAARADGRRLVVSHGQLEELARWVIARKIALTKISGSPPGLVGPEIAQNEPWMALG